MQTLTEIKAMLEARGLSPRTSLGQNFLVDHNLLRKIVDASGAAAGDLVLEVGPGTGALTAELLARGCEVVACELDRGLAVLLRDLFAAEIAGGRLCLIEGDALDPGGVLSARAAAALGGRPFRLVANLPYGIATPLITTLLLDHPPCPGMFVTIQREVGERLAAGPGTKAYGPLGVLVGALAEVRPIAALPPECFWPRPKVASVMVSITRRPTPRCNDPRALEAMLHRVFGQRRKQLGSILGRRFPWPAGVRAQQRAEELAIEQLIALSEIGLS